MKVVSPKYCRTAARLAKLLESELAGRRYLILTDETVSDCCLPHLSEFLVEFPPIDIIEVDCGEVCKQYDVAVELWKHLLELNITRFDVIICIGGGSITDLGGFVASTFKRGMPFIYIPTTLLAMTDAAFGGKNGIDFQGVKNVIGTINQPEAIFIYKPFLATLPEAQFLSGMAEVIKHGVIQGGGLWQRLKAESSRKFTVSDDVLKLSIETKLSIVKKDLHEQNLRKVLNFGHSIGHALESCYLSKGMPIEHGLAVAKGMIIESALAAEMGLLNQLDLMEIHSVLTNYVGLGSCAIPNWTEVVPFLRNDKKFSHDKMLFALPIGIGKMAPSVVVEEELLELVYSKVIC
jgi:3-dehydroquinate synthase